MTVCRLILVYLRNSTFRNLLIVTCSDWDSTWNRMESLLDPKFIYQESAQFTKVSITYLLYYLLYSKFYVLRFLANTRHYLLRVLNSR